MSDHRRGQVVGNAATIYESFFVPALFQAWPPRLVSRANVTTNQRLLDVACGTGVLARHAAEIVGTGGSVYGVDQNEHMLEVAQATSSKVNFQRANAENLPFDDGYFDAVCCQFGLMFFSDPREALREMNRVTRPGGHVVIAVWSTLKETPGYQAMSDLLASLFSEDVAASLRTPYALGDPAALRRTMYDSGIRDVRIERIDGSAVFPSLSSWLYTDIRGWTLADVINDDDFEMLTRAADRSLSKFVNPDGSVRFDAPALIATVAVPEMTQRRSS